ncbi:hypothetical protein MRX96_032175 [Rhipicephalus microplus]
MFMSRKQSSLECEAVCNSELVESARFLLRAFCMSVGRRLQRRQTTRPPHCAHVLPPCVFLVNGSFDASRSVVVSHVATRADRPGTAPLSVSLMRAIVARPAGSRSANPTGPPDALLSARKQPSLTRRQRVEGRPSEPVALTDP